MLNCHVFCYVGNRNPESKPRRKRVTVGEKEKKFVVECYNFCNGKKWSDVLVYAKSKLLDAGLPDHVVNLYLNCKNDRIITRMKNIVKNFVEESQDSAATTSTHRQQMKYATKQTPSQRKEEVKRRIREEFIDSSSSSSSDEDNITTPAEKKRKTDCASEANSAHKEMCRQAMETMNNVNKLLEKVSQKIDD